MLPSTEKLYLTGLHLEQYRHATRDAAPYFQEALQRDSGDARNNNALGLSELKQGLFEKAAFHFRQSINRLTEKNPNPFDCEPFYNLGVTLRFMENLEEAYTAFYKASWDASWKAASYFALAQLDCRAKNWELALNQINQTLHNNILNSKGRNFKAVILRKMGRWNEVEELISNTLSADLLDFQTRNELYLLQLEDETRREQAKTTLSELENLMRDQSSTYLDIAIDYAEAGLWQEACDLIERLVAKERANPLVCYHLAYYHDQQGNSATAFNYYSKAARLPSDYCFPNRLESIRVLQTAQERNPADARAPYYLGNLLYDKKRYDAAIEQWELARNLDPAFSIVHRNLGLAYFNYLKDPVKALVSDKQAWQAKPDDARLLFELDQLEKRLEKDPHERLRRLEDHKQLVEQRDDLYLELVTLYNQLGQPENALMLLQPHRFHPWEGGEGKVVEQYVLGHLLQGQDSLRKHNPDEALKEFLATLKFPPNLGEENHPVFTSQARSFHYLGLVYQELGDQIKSNEYYRKALAEVDKPDMESLYYLGLAWLKLGDVSQANKQAEALEIYARQLLETKPNIDYFATSLPSFLLFEDDLRERTYREAQHLLKLRQELLKVISRG